MGLVLSLINVFNNLDVVNDVEVFSIESLATDIPNTDENVVSLR